MYYKILTMQNTWFVLKNCAAPYWKVIINTDATYAGCGNVRRNSGTGSRFPLQHSWNWERSMQFTNNPVIWSAGIPFTESPQGTIQGHGIVWWWTKGYPKEWSLNLGSWRDLARHVWSSLPVNSWPGFSSSWQASGTGCFDSQLAITSTCSGAYLTSTFPLCADICS